MTGQSSNGWRSAFTFGRAHGLVILLYVVVFLSWLAIQPNGDTGLMWFSDLALAGGALAAGLMSITMALMTRGEDRPAWALLGAGALSWGLGQVVWSYYELVLHQETPFPSFADLGYLGAIPLMLAGVLRLPRSEGRDGASQALVGLDALVAMCSVATVSWYILLGPMYTDGSSPLLERAIGIAYPAGDLLLMFAVIGVAMRGWVAGQGRILTPLVLGLAVFAVADSGFTYLNLHNAYVSGSPIDLGWPLGLLLISHAAVRRWRGASAACDSAAEAQPHGRRRMDVVLSAGPYVLVVLVIALMFSSGFDLRNADRHVLVALGYTTIMLVLARQFLTLRQNLNLTNALRSFSRSLEERIAERTAKLSVLYRTASDLAAVASADEVRTVGLEAIREAAGGNSAVLYLADGDEFVVAEGEDATTPPAKLPPGLSGADLDIAVPVRAGGDALLPIRIRGRTQGLVAVTGLHTAEIDLEHLAALTSEFGVAHENQRRLEEAMRLADRDPVTGVFNHRYLHSRLNDLIEECGETGENLSLVLGDINDFKLFNDTYGHQTGDEVLRIVAKEIAALCPAGGVVARFGGDEFAAVLPGFNAQRAVGFCENLQSSLSQRAFQQPGSERIPVTLTLGYATFPDHGTRRYELVASADSRLYEAKRAGQMIPAVNPHNALIDTPGTFTFLDALITSVDNKDRYTKRHCDLVCEYAVLTGEAMGLSNGVQRSLSIAGALHDVGKICIPDRILRKPGPLDDDEYEIIKLHVPLAASLIQHVPRRREVLDGVLNHHERWDGEGYPKGVAGLRIPLVGRVMAIADAFSAMTLDRPYRKALPFDWAIQELQKNRGTQFDGDIVDVFVAAFERRMSSHDSVA